METLTSYVTSALRDRAATANPGAEVSSAIPWHVWMARSLADDEAGYVSLLDPNAFGPAIADLLDAFAADDTAAAKKIAANLVGGLAATLQAQASSAGATPDDSGVVVSMIAV